MQSKNFQLALIEKKVCSTLLCTLRGQTVRFVNCERITQQTKIMFVAESATLLLLSDLLCFVWFQIFKALYHSKSLPNFAGLENLRQYLQWLLLKQKLKYRYSKTELARNPQLSVESANCKQKSTNCKRNLRFSCGFQ